MADQNDGSPASGEDFAARRCTGHQVGPGYHHAGLASNCPKCARTLMSDLLAEIERLRADLTLVRQEGLTELYLREFRDGTLHLVPSESMALIFVESFRTLLDENDAPNYVEMQVQSQHRPGELYGVIICRPYAKTPHILRREAEAQRDRILDALDMRDLETDLDIEQAYAELANALADARKAREATTTKGHAQ